MKVRTPVCARQPHEVTDLVHVRGERPFAQHVLAGFESGTHKRMAARRLDADDDEIHCWIGGELAWIGVSAARAPLVRRGLSRLLPCRADSRHLKMRQG